MYWKHAQAPASLPAALRCTDGKPNRRETEDKRLDMEIKNMRGPLAPASTILTFQGFQTGTTHLETSLLTEELGGMRVQIIRLPGPEGPLS